MNLCRFKLGFIRFEDYGAALLRREVRAHREKEEGKSGKGERVVNWGSEGAYTVRCEK